MESFATTRDLVALAGPSLGEGAAVGTLDMLSAEGGQPNEHQYANFCDEHKLLSREYNATITSSLLSFKFPPWEKHLFILDSRPRYARVL